MMTCRAEHLAAGTTCRLAHRATRQPWRTVTTITRLFTWGTPELHIRFSDGSKAVSAVDTKWEVQQ